MPDLFSNDPADLRQMADESIALLKEELAAFDAEERPRYERLSAYAREARNDGRSERYYDLSELADKTFANWQRGREPFLREIQSIAMARDAVTPREITFTWAKAVFTGFEAISR